MGREGLVICNKREKKLIWSFNDTLIRKEKCVIKLYKKNEIHSILRGTEFSVAVDRASLIQIQKSPARPCLPVHLCMPLNMFSPDVSVFLSGYIEAVVIPAGARRIKVVEDKPSHSFLGNDACVSQGVLAP